MNSRWPSPHTVPSHLDMEYALLGLTSSLATPSLAQPQTQNSHFSLYGQTTHQYYHQSHSNGVSHPGAESGEAVAEEYAMRPTDCMPSTGYDLTAIEPWSAVRLSQQGALLAWEGQQDEDVTGVTRLELNRL